MPQRYNALKHGLYTQEVCLPFEDRRKYLRFCREYIKSLDPENLVRDHQAEQLADQSWILKRLNQSLLAHQEETFERLKPKDLAAILDLPVLKDQLMVNTLMRFESADGVPAGNIKLLIL